jgi:di/tripeptidase
MGSRNHLSDPGTVMALESFRERFPQAPKSSFKFGFSPADEIGGAKDDHYDLSNPKCSQTLWESA